MSRTYDNEKKPSQSTFSFKPTASFLQTRPFAPVQTDLDEDAAPRPSGYTENFLEKIINQRSTESSDTPVQAKPMNRLRRPLQDKRVSMIQAKLSIGEPNDKYEQEADATASKVVQQINSPMQDQSVQKQESMEEEEELQMKPISSIQREAAIGEEEELQMKSLVQRRENFGGGEASTDLESSIQRARSSGQSLDPNLQEKMGQAMGADFSSVKVHTDSQSDQLNKSIQAKAFTTGQDIFFRQGEYSPSSTGGQELLAHELTHVVQQNGNTVQRRKKVQMKPDLQLHQEEDEVQMKPDLQLHQEEDEVQMKPDLQLHQEEDEVQMKPDLQLKAESTSTSCQCSSCNPSSVSIQRKATQSGDVRDLLNRKLADIVNIQRKASNGDHCSGCACNTCAGNNQIQRKTEESHGSGCSCTQCSGGSKIQAKLIQAKPVANQVTPTVKQTAHSNVIQRHSSWEHQLLGDADPNDLAKIGNWQDLIDKTKKKGSFGSRKREMEKAEVVDIDGVGKITKGNIMHVISQELQRLNDWQKNPPQKGTSGEIDPKYQTVLVALPGGGKDGISPFVITYGEMNTLADYYGNVDLMKTADPKARFQLVQSVRQETFFRLKEIYGKLNDSLTSTEEKDQDVKDAKKMMKGNALVNQKLGFKFEGAITPDYISGKAGQIELLKGIQSIGTKEDTNQYTPTLARNACHFVPESWHSWALYHEKAIVKAKESFGKKNKAQQKISEAQQKQKAIEGGKNFDNQQNFQNDINLKLIEIDSLKEEVKSLNTESADLANDAIIDNGFGDHYLQDSYAGGHMINKTKIMQWFVQWLDTQQWTMDYAGDDKWRKVQAIAYKQPELASQTKYKKNDVQGYDPTDQTSKAQNPQVVEDIGGDDWMVRFKALGLQVPSSLKTVGTPSRELMEWWQTESAMKSSKTKQTGKSLLAGVKALDFDSLKLALKSLISDGIVYLDFSADKTGKKVLSGENVFNVNASQKSFESFKFALRPQYVPKDIHKLTSAMKKSSTGDDSEYQKMASAITYQDYMAFMNNAYVQKSTNALHDAFCKDGLEVRSNNDQGTELFRAYGDDSMFNQGSAKGLKHSGDTAKMSRDSIRNYISTGKDEVNTTASILDRLPAWVQTPKFKDGKGGGTVMSIEAWHDPSKYDNLKSYCESNIFPGMGVIDKVVGMTGDLTPFISKDKAKVHGSDAF
jgi:hypothetical protein